MLKINRKKLITSLGTVSTFGLLLILFSTSVLAISTVRPISDFTATNDNIAAWADTDSGLIMFPHGWFIYGFPSGPQSIAECMPSGSVLEQELKDGQMMYKVNLHVEGALMVIANISSGIVLVEGVMNYFFQGNMLIYDGELGDPVPNLLQVWFPGVFLPPGTPPIGEGTFSHLTGTGTGIMQVDALGFNAGDTVHVKINQVGLYKPEGHPHYPQMWTEILVFN
ncbi:MAG: hypothetical protein ACFFA7_11700 [Promethearchaeota archaeon]